LVASYDLQPGNGAGAIFWKVRDRRRNRREGKTHKKGRRKNTNRKGKQRQSSEDTVRVIACGVSPENRGYSGKDF